MAKLARLGRRLRRPLTVVPIIAVIGGAFYLGSRAKSGSSAAATTVIDRTVDVTSGPMRQTVNASGTLAPADTENLSFAVSGKVTAVGVTAGQHVAKGAVLATLDSAALQSAVTQAQATVDSAQAKLASDTAAHGSAAQLAADQANVTAAQASLADANAALAGATLTAPIDGTVSIVNLAVGQQLGSGGTSGTGLTGSATGSGRTSGSSSSGSTGGSQSNASGSTGSSGSSGSNTQIQLISTGSYVVDLSVDDTQVGLLKAGQPATVTRSNAAVAGTGRAARGVGQGQGGAAQNGNGAAAAGGGQTTNGSNQPGTTNRAAPSSATGTVTSVGTIATSTSGVSTFPVVVTVDGSPTDFFAGATVEVSITYNQLDDVVQVPTAAVTQQNGQSFVTVVNGGNRVATPVKTGLVSGGQTQITSGVDAGEQVLVRITVPAGAAGNGTANRTGGVLGGGGGGTGRTGTGGGFGSGGFGGRSGD